jgi:hypothetical protein
VIRVPTVAAGCACAYDLWTTDGGRHWHPTRAIAGGLVGRGRSLYWLVAGAQEIRQVTPWPPVDAPRSRTVAAIDSGTVVALSLVPAGVAALIKDPSGRAPSVLVVRSTGEPQWQALPAPPGVLIAQSLRSSGRTLIVDGTVFRDGTTARVRWISTGGPDGWEPLPS